MNEQDHIDRFMERLGPLVELGVDLEAEGIVDRIAGIDRRIKKGMEQVLAEHGLTFPDWQVLTALVLDEPDHRSSPGALSTELELSSGAMTSRLDRLEQMGFVRRLRHHADRRGVVVELTPAGRIAWDSAASIQARREAFFASALSKAEQKRLNALLRKLMLAFEHLEARTPQPGSAAPPRQPG